MYLSRLAYTRLVEESLSQLLSMLDLDIDDSGNLLAGGLTETRLVQALCFCLKIPVSTSDGFFAMFVKCKLVDRSC